MADRLLTQCEPWKYTSLAIWIKQPRANQSAMLDGQGLLLQYSRLDLPSQPLIHPVTPCQCACLVAHDHEYVWFTCKPRRRLCSLELARITPGLRVDRSLLHQAFTFWETAAVGRCYYTQLLPTTYSPAGIFTLFQDSWICLDFWLMKDNGIALPTVPSFRLRELVLATDVHKVAMISESTF